MDAWNVACLRTNAHPTLLRRDEEACLIFLSHVARLHLVFQIKCDSIKLLTYMKARVNHVVDSAYGFDSSRSHDSIIRNVTRAQALLANTTFIYRVCPVALHIQPTEDRQLVLRISTLASVRVLYTDIA